MGTSEEPADSSIEHGNQPAIFIDISRSHPEIRIPEKDITTLIAETGLNKPQYSETLEAIKKCKYLGTAPEFYYMLSSGNSSLIETVNNSLVLGLRYFGENIQPGVISKPHVYDTLANSAEALDYMQVGKRVKDLGLESAPAANPSSFLPNAVNAVEGVVFFVPPNFFKENNNGVTNQEFNWFISHPEHIPKLLLVFGAYETINTESLRYAWILERQLIANPEERLLSGYTGHLAIQSLKELMSIFQRETSQEKELKSMYKQFPEILESPCINDLELHERDLAKQQLAQIDAFMLLFNVYLKSETSTLISSDWRKVLIQLTQGSGNYPVTQELLIKLHQLSEITSDNHAQFLNDSRTVALELLQGLRS